MNKLSLEFKDESLEDKFQQSQMQITQQNTLNAIYILSFTNLFQTVYWFINKQFILGSSTLFFFCYFAIVYHHYKLDKKRSFHKYLKIQICTYSIINQFACLFNPSHLENDYIGDITLQMCFHLNHHSNFITNTSIYCLFILFRIGLRLQDGFCALSFLMVLYLALGICKDYQRIHGIRTQFLLTESTEIQTESLEKLSNECFFVLKYDTLWQKFVHRFSNKMYKRQISLKPIEFLQNITIKKSYQSGIQYLFTKSKNFEQFFTFEAIQQQSKQKFKIDCLVYQLQDILLTIKVTKIQKKSPANFQPLFYRTLVNKLKLRNPKLYYKESYKNLIATLLVDPKKVPQESLKLTNCQIRRLSQYLSGKPICVTLSQEPFEISLSPKLLNVLFYSLKKLYSISHVHIEYNQQDSTLQFNINGDSNILQVSHELIHFKVANRILGLIGIGKLKSNVDTCCFTLFDLQHYDKYLFS